MGTQNLHMSRERTILIWILIIAVSLSAVSVFVFIGLERYSLATERVEKYENQIRLIAQELLSEKTLLERREMLLESVKEEKRYFYTQAEMDPYAFGILVKDILTSLKLDLTRYQTIESGKGAFLEFNLSGDVLNVIEFLRKVSDSQKYWSVPYLVVKMRPGGNSSDVVLRIGYEVVD